MLVQRIDPVPEEDIIESWWTEEGYSVALRNSADGQTGHVWRVAIAIPRRHFNYIQLRRLRDDRHKPHPIVSIRAQGTIARQVHGKHGTVLEWHQQQDKTDLHILDWAYWFVRLVSLDLSLYNQYHDTHPKFISCPWPDLVPTPTLVRQQALNAPREQSPSVFDRVIGNFNVDSLHRASMSSPPLARQHAELVIPAEVTSLRLGSSNQALNAPSQQAGWFIPEVTSLRLGSSNQALNDPSQQAGWFIPEVTSLRLGSSNQALNDPSEPSDRVIGVFNAGSLHRAPMSSPPLLVRQQALSLFETPNEGSIPMGGPSQRFLRDSDGDEGMRGIQLVRTIMPDEPIRYLRLLAEARPLDALVAAREEPITQTSDSDGVENMSSFCMPALEEPFTLTSDSDDDMPASSMADDDMPDLIPIRADVREPCDHIIIEQREGVNLREEMLRDWNGVGEPIDDPSPRVIIGSQHVHEGMNLREMAERINPDSDEGRELVMTASTLNMFIERSQRMSW